MKISSEVKVVGTACIAALLIIGIAIFSLAGTPQVSGTDRPTISKEQVVAENGLHWHPTLTIIIDGIKQEIPPNIGLGAVHLPLHTHDDAVKGVVHMEFSGTVLKDDTKVGKFFTTWEKTFSSTQIFDKKNTDEKKVTMTVNGEINTQLENYEMKDGDEIVIRYE